MTLTFDLPEDVKAKLDAKARSEGLDFSTYVQRLLKADAALPPLGEVLRPIRDAFKASGMTEDELTQMLEKAKHDIRADRRAREPNAKSG
jgi:hypothetical protein